MNRERTQGTQKKENCLENPLKGGVPVGRGGFFQCLEQSGAIFHHPLSPPPSRKATVDKRETPSINSGQATEGVRGETFQKESRLFLRGI